MTWQPTLHGERLHLRPMRKDDFDALFRAASDRKIWELHPDPLRHTRERFQIYFDTGMQCGGALVVEHDGEIVGGSRYTDASDDQVEIGWTFLTRKYWGGSFNRELKTLMMTHAFKHVRRCIFVVGKDNLRSRAAMTKIGGVLIPIAEAKGREVDPNTHVVFKIDRGSPRDS